MDNNKLAINKLKKFDDFIHINLWTFLMKSSILLLIIAICNENFIK